MAANDRSAIELLFRVSREFATALDLKTVLTRVLFAAIENVGGERGSVIVLDDNGRAVDSAIVYGNQLRESTTLQLRDTIDRGLAGWVVRSRQGALVPDTSKDERWLRREDDAVDKSGAKSAMCVPLLSREKLVGVLTLVHPVPKAYDDSHLELMQAIADQAGISILNARLYAESQRQARVMTALAESAASINTSLRTEQAFERILNQTRQALQVDTAAIGLVDASGELVFQAASGEGADAIRGKRIRNQGGVAGKVIAEGRGLVVQNTSEETLLDAAEKAIGRVRAVCCAPIHAQGKVIGVLEAFNPTNKVFDVDALLVLTGLGSLAGTTIQNAQFFEQLDDAHRRYRDLFEDSIDPIFITDLEGHILEANLQAMQSAGYTQDDLRKMTIDQVHEVDFTKTGNIYEKVAEKTLSYESGLVSKDGEKLPVQVYARRVKFDDAESIQWILRDIRERKELDSLREDLTAMIYHDLRSPLANILSSVELMSDMFSDEERESGLSIAKIANLSIDRIQRLVNSLLDVNRLEQNQPIGSRKPASFDDILGDALEAVQPRATDRQQLIKANVAVRGLTVNVDADMIRRVLINLLENAVKYTPAKSQIDLSAIVDGDWLNVAVQDNGPGIPESEWERIFDKYTRLKAGGMTGGLGVGLAFCKLAVQAHGGRIWVENAPQRGSRFVFTLPLHKE